MKERPEAIMINVPEAFFRETEGKRDAFERYYETMGHGAHEIDCFYHWISCVPIHDVTHVYVCYLGFVRYKAIVVQKIKQEAPFPYWEIRNWLVVTGPVTKPPVEMPQRGFRGFRYTKHLF